MRKRVKISGENFQVDKAFRSKKKAESRQKSIRTGQYSKYAQPRKSRIMKEGNSFIVVVGKIRKDISSATWTKLRKKRDALFGKKRGGK